MTDKKISELTSLTGANVSDANDVVAIVDSDQNTTKKITRAEFFKNVSSVDINGGTIDGTVIGDSTPAAVTGTTITATGDVDVADKITHTGDTDTSIRFPAADTVTVETAGSERVRVDSSGNVGIGASSPSEELSVAGNISATNLFVTSEGDTSTNNISGGFRHGGVNSKSLVIEADPNNVGGATVMRFEVDGSEAMRIDASGNVGIGTSSPSQKLRVVGTSGTAQFGAGTSGNALFVNAFDSNPIYMTASAASSTAFGFGAASNIPLFFMTNNAERMRITSSGNVGIGTSSPSEKLDVSGNVTISGSLSKGSGSFKIDHPIKPDTHHLVHSFIEGPQADNIYRGKVALVDGTATVNLDEAGRMTEGTFVALNGNVQCFTTNEDGWTAVRGKVDGNILTIEAQDATCTDTVSWLVIGERHDQHMIDANWTDEQGRIITEPEKETNQ